LWGHASRHTLLWASVETGGDHGSPPQVITRHTLENPPAEQTTNIQRGQAFAHDGVWAGFVVFPGGASTGWPHHGDYATYGYVTSGGMIVEFAPDGGADVIVRVGGAGATVFNVEGPDPAT
jgi:hypothetical protein